MKSDRGKLTTEKRNPLSENIDKLSTHEILAIINKEDHKIAASVKAIIPQIEKAVDLTVSAIRKGNKIVYIGAGTSGRLGILDASEIPPTFSAPSDWFAGVIAGGREAVFRSIEGAEDIPENSHNDLDKVGTKQGDVLIGIASSSTTPYVLEALKYGKQIGCKAIFIVCNSISDKEAEYDLLIPINVGPEIITGSTRMKSGTATKLVLNMLSTTTMIRLGKVYGNMMVDLQVVNEKLRDRGTRIIRDLTGLDYRESHKYLEAAQGSVKSALVMINKKCSLIDAKILLEKNEGNLRNIIGDIS